ncbi:sterol desaturase family protein [Roseibium litorale]|uniref:Sterol desaturase family protein n=1 Tax=Roseibium litorale TaxID=2803841 RepID=A0ABR9CM53_9HYPH|nr:sterol desaturase family protein [Roseibium litorale]MBD8891793.1 sterol desaturase family protein [Roseibium litorale]
MMVETLVRLKDGISVLFMRSVSEPGFWMSLSLVAVAFLVLWHRSGYSFRWPCRLMKSVGANISFFFLNMIFTPIVLVLAGFVQSAYDMLGVPTLDSGIWTPLPTWVLAFLAVLFYDFANYWNHRLMHMGWLWPVHAIHHSDPEVNGLTGYRIHFLEVFIMAASYVILLSWLGFPAEGMGLGAVFIALHGVYVHLDLDWGHGPLRYLIASPRFHRWHHADVPAAYGKNLANIFPFFDVLFGTYRVPGPVTGPLGAQGVPENDVVKLCLFPFTEWTRMLVSGVRQLGRRSSDGAAKQGETSGL